MITKRFVGIDLGTTNSTISIAYTKPNGDVEAQTLEVTQIDETGNNMTQDFALPSVVYFDDEDQPYVGHFAKRMLGTYPKQVVKEAKRYIGQESSWPINNRKIRPDEISSYILKLLKTQVEAYFGQNIESAVITVPANFNFQQENATRYAAELSGFSKTAIHTIPEPTAALLDFLNEEQKFEPSQRRIDVSTGKKKLLVFDLGGGTCDVSILEVEFSPSGKIEIQELSISQYTELGGIDFDRQVSFHLLSGLLKEWKIPNIQQFRVQYGDDVLKQLLESLTDFAEKAKKSFSVRIDNQIRLQGLDPLESSGRFDDLSFRQMLPDKLPSELVTTLNITKKVYDVVIESLLYKEKSKSGKNIEDPILGALNQSKYGVLKKSDIDAIFLVGGMTYYPTIQMRIYEIFDCLKKPLRSMNPMFAVSRGAAIYHQSLDKITFHPSEASDGQTPHEGIVGFTSTVPSNVYIDVIGGDPVPLLEKGTPLPFNNLIEGKFFVTGQGNTEFVNSMQLDLFTAISPKAIQVTKLKSATISFKKPVPVKTPLILNVSCSIEREVIVKAWLATDESEVIDVNLGSHEYSSEEKESMTARLQGINKIKE